MPGRPAWRATPRGCGRLPRLRTLSRPCVVAAPSWRLSLVPGSISPLLGGQVGRICWGVSVTG
jgi:hypothetical protein